MCFIPDEDDVMKLVEDDDTEFFAECLETIEYQGEEYCVFERFDEESILILRRTSKDEFMSVANPDILDAILKIFRERRGMSGFTYW